MLEAKKKHGSCEEDGGENQQETKRKVPTLRRKNEKPPDQQ